MTQPGDCAPTYPDTPLWFDLLLGVIALAHDLDEMIRRPRRRSRDSQY
jgi:hypothetical protein